MSTIESTTYAAPGEAGSPVELQERYDNFVGGEWLTPTTGEYRENVTPSTGEPFCEVAHSGGEDIELALDAAHAAKDEWGRRSPGERAAVLNRVADAIHSELEDIRRDVRAFGAQPSATAARNSQIIQDLEGSFDEEFARHVVDDLVLPALINYRKGET